MNIVLYTRDFEPITVLDLPFWLLEQLEQQGKVRVAVLRPTQFASNQVPVGPVESPDVVSIYCEKLQWRDGTIKPVLITHDEELALALRPSWIPGQTQLVQGYQAALRHLTEQLIKTMRK